MRGQIWIQDWFGLLLTGVIAVGVLPFILPGQVSKISPEINSTEFENKAILLANSLMSNPNLIYSDNRAMFDEEKLNVNMVEKSRGKSILDCSEPESSICKLNSYPESFSLILVKDTERGKGWFSVMRSGSLEFKNRIDKCFSNFNKIEELFKDDSIVQTLNIQGCEFARSSRILSERFENFDSQKHPHLFPLTIRDVAGKVHMGWIKVVVVE